MSVWESIDELFDDRDVDRVTSSSDLNQPSGNNEDDLDQEELFGIVINADTNLDEDDDFGLGTKSRETSEPNSTQPTTASSSLTACDEPKKEPRPQLIDKESDLKPVEIERPVENCEETEQPETQIETESATKPVVPSRSDSLIDEDKRTRDFDDDEDEDDEEDKKQARFNHWCERDSVDPKLRAAGLAPSERTSGDSNSNGSNRKPLNQHQNRPGFINNNSVRKNMPNQTNNRAGYRPMNKPPYMPPGNQNTPALIMNPGVGLLPTPFNPPNLNQQQHPVNMLMPPLQPQNQFMNMNQPMMAPYQPQPPRFQNYSYQRPPINEPQTHHMPLLSNTPMPPRFPTHQHLPIVNQRPLLDAPLINPRPSQPGNVFPPNYPPPQANFYQPQQPVNNYYQTGPPQIQPPPSIHGIDSADLLPSPKPTTVFINPSFIPKPARSRKDLDLLLEKKLAEALKEAENQMGDEKETPKSTRSEKTADKEKEKTAVKRKSSPPVPRLQSKVNVIQPPLKKKSSDDTKTSEKKPSPADIGIELDPDYNKKLDEQKRKREMILKAKEEKRNQRIMEAKKSGGGESVTQTNGHRVVVVDAEKSAHKRVLVQNISPNTSEKNINKMCTEAGIKDKVVKIHIHKNEAEIVFSDLESAKKFFKKFNRFNSILVANYRNLKDQHLKPCSVNMS